MTPLDPLDPTGRQLDSSDLWNNPQVAAVARRIQQQYAIDPLDSRCVEIAVADHLIQIGSGPNKVASRGVFAFIFAASFAVFPWPFLIVTVPLFGLMAFLSVKEWKKYVAESREERQRTMPYIAGHIACIRALSTDPAEQRRIEKAWRRRHGLNLKARYELPPLTTS